MPQKEENPQFLECESRLIYGLLMASGGLLGAFTYLRRGGVFCNAQTGNFVLLSMALYRRALFRGRVLFYPHHGLHAGRLCLGASV